MAQCDERILAGTAVITGAGGGLGRALARDLCARGMHVVGLGRRIDALNETRELADGDLFFPIKCDIADGAAVMAAFADITTQHAPISLLINNAAVYPHRDILDETTQSFMDTVNVNLGGMFACTRAALVPMVSSGFGRIMNVATFADIAPLPTSAAYSVSKGAARIFTRALVADLGDRFPEIVINDWMPGMLTTKMGIPDGISPEISAQWGAGLALWHDRALNGTIFERDREILPQRSLKGRIKDRILMRKSAQPRVLG